MAVLTEPIVFGGCEVIAGLTQDELFLNLQAVIILGSHSRRLNDLVHWMLMLVSRLEA
jgi:hypothetical protein